MQAVGLQTFIWNNNLRSILLLIGFPVLLTGMIWAAEMALIGAGYIPSSGSLGGDFGLSGRILLQSIPLAVVVAGVWFVIAYFANQTIIDLVTGARKVERRDMPELYNLLENLCISRGMRTPTLRIIETDALNAFASGVHEGQFSITVTRGLLDAMDREELEAVLAHELTHVINRDVRTMVVAAIFAGIITLLAQVIYRGLFWMGGGRRGRDSKGGGGLFVIIALAIAAIGYVLAIVIRMTLSRQREYVADAGSVELTKNPDAMIRALRRIEGHAHIDAPEEVRGMFLDNEEDGVWGLFATHPSIDKRVAALVKFGGGRDPGPYVETAPPPAAEPVVQASGPWGDPQPDPAPPKGPWG